MENINNINFDDFYYENIRKYAEELRDIDNELLELKMLKNFLTVIIALLLIAAAIIFKTFNEEITLFCIVSIYMFLMFMVITIGNQVVNSKKNSNVMRANTVFNDEIMPKIVSFIGEDLKYISNGISLEKIYQSKLFIKGIEKFMSKNLIYGCFKSLNIELAYIEVMSTLNKAAMTGKIYIIYSVVGIITVLLNLIGIPNIVGLAIGTVLVSCFLYKYLHRKRSYDNNGDIFCGIFFSIDFNKEINSLTIVKPDNLEKKIGEYGRVIQEAGLKNGLEIARLENIEFENEFIVLTNNQQEARYILTPAIMEKLLILVNEKNVRAFSFYKGKINLAIENYNFREILFEKDKLYNYCNDINKIFEIIDILDLNTRIWSKE